MNKNPTAPPRSSWTLHDNLDNHSSPPCKYTPFSTASRNPFPQLGSSNMSDTDTPKGFAPFDLFPYNPQLAPAFAFLGLFGAVAILHLMAMIPYRSFFTLPLVIGCASKSLSKSKQLRAPLLRRRRSGKRVILFPLPLPRRRPTNSPFHHSEPPGPLSSAILSCEHIHVPSTHRPRPRGRASQRCLPMDHQDLHPHRHWLFRNAGRRIHHVRQ